MTAYHVESPVSQVGESSTIRLGGTLRDDAGQAIAGSTLSTCTLTVYDSITGQPVSGYSGTDIKSSVDESGVLSHRIPAAALVSSAIGRRAYRTILVRFTYGGGGYAGWHRWPLIIVLDPVVT